MYAFNIKENNKRRNKGKKETYGREKADGRCYSNHVSNNNKWESI